MKVAVISDIHGNLEALNTVYEHMHMISRCVDEVWCLGDVIGYGPCPSECLASARQLCSWIVKGNHEDCVSDSAKDIEVNKSALRGIKFTRSQLTEADIGFLKNLPEKVIIDDLGVTLCHGAFTEPSMWKYINSRAEAKAELVYTPTWLCLTGHTHCPFVFSEKEKFRRVLPESVVLDKNQKHLINVGSVGQPRDGDCRASYGILEFTKDQVVFRPQRVFYNIENTARQIRQAGLPDSLAERLFRGE